MAEIFRLLPKKCLKFIYSLTKNTGGFIGLGFRYVCIKNLAKACGENVAIFPNCVIKHPENLCIGNNVSLHPYCYVDAIGGIEIGSNVSIANHSSLISFGHTWNDMDTPIKYNPLVLTPIRIADDVWIGCGCRILGECNIRTRTVIAAGAVAKGNYSSDAIYGGVPAKLIKQMNNNKLTNLGGG